MCEDNGLSFVAVVEWGADGYGTTTSMRSGAGVAFRLVEMAVRAKGNFDAVTIDAARYAREHGHNSVVLNLIKRAPVW